MHALTAIPILSLQWCLFGYTLAFGSTKVGLVGGLDFVGLRGLESATHGTVPALAFVAFQMMFAVITPALISGAFAERMKFTSYLVFILAWSTLVYDPVAHWVWADGGWLSKLGALDFAGGTVVHLTAGVSALVSAIVIGKRVGYPRRKSLPHNLTMTLTGAGLLWFGWFGFNAGSALAANRSAVLAFVNTNTAAAAATLSWALIEYLHKGKATVLGACSGAVAGLVAITPAAGFVNASGALGIGLLVSPLCYGAILMKGKAGYDDSLDVFGVHGVGGACGAVAVGLFATGAMTAVSGITGDVGGLIEGKTDLIVKQGLSLLAAGGYSFVVSFVILKLVDLTIGLRVTEEEEEVGLDLSQHGERGYIMGVGELMGGHPAASVASMAHDASYYGQHAEAPQHGERVGV
jgi:Amt family ammonium transporter